MTLGYLPVHELVAHAAHFFHAEIVLGV